MNKKLLALKILLSVLVVLLVALITLQIKSIELHNDNENGLIFIVALLLNIIPMFAMIILGAATAVVIVLLFIVKKKVPVIVSTLIILCLLMPFAGFSLFVDITSLGIFIEVPIIAGVVFAINVAAMVLCCMAIHESRKAKKNVNADENQITENIE